MLSLETRFPVFDISCTKFCIFWNRCCIKLLSNSCNKYLSPKLYFKVCAKTCAISVYCSNVLMENIVFRICTWPKNRRKIKSIVSLWPSNQYSTQQNVPGVLMIFAILNRQFYTYDKIDMIPTLETSTHEDVGSWYYTAIYKWCFYARNNGRDQW